MKLHSVTLLAASSSLASAFLVLPSAESGAEGSNQLHGDGLLVNSKERLVKLECKGCPFAKPESEAGIQWVDDVENSLVSRPT